MAFTYCTNCGEKIDIDNAVCPYCGHRRAGYSYGREAHSEPKDTFESYYEDSRQNRDSYGENRNGYGNGPYGQTGGQGFNGGGYRPERPLYRTPDSMRPKRPISVGLTVFSIINIIFSCCALPSLVFGILALVNTVQAQNAESEEQETAKKKIALILNVVGAALAIITLVSFCFVFADALAQYIANGGV